MKKHLPNFLEVFEGRLAKMRDRIRQELDLPKEQRTKQHLRKWLQDAKKLQKMVHEVKAEHGATCPHCGKRI